jgi:hypothetical protein
MAALTRIDPLLMHWAVATQAGGSRSSRCAASGEGAKGGLQAGWAPFSAPRGPHAAALPPWRAPRSRFRRARGRPHARQRRRQPGAPSC